MVDPCEWLIRKDGYYYRPNFSGYTTSKFEAGRYTKAEADREAAIEPWHMKAVHQDDIEDDPVSSRVRMDGDRIATLAAEVERFRSERSYVVGWNDGLAHARAEASAAVKVPDPRHFNILAEAMAEVKASSDGLSEQPIADIVQGCIDEISALTTQPAAPQEAEAVPVAWRNMTGGYYHGSKRPNVDPSLLLHPLYTSPPAQAVTEARKFQLGDRVTKTKGSSWTGQVVGFYSTALTPVGYCVESETETGSVQIYPESALTASQEAGHDAA